MKRVIYALLLTISAFLLGHAQSSYLAGSMHVFQSEVPQQELVAQVSARLLSPINSPTEDSIAVTWGDGSTGWLFLEQELPLTAEVTERLYIHEHVYPAAANYTISSPVCCFSETIANVDQGATLTLQTEYSFLNPQFQGYNSTVQVLQLEDAGLVDEPLEFLPLPIDGDNDSIIVSIADLQGSIPGYQPVNIVDPGGLGTLIVEDSFVGLTIWESPSIAGKSYIVPLLVEDFRNGQRVSSSLLYYWIRVVMPTSTTTASKPDLKVFPNPASQTLQVQTENPTQWSGVLYNAQGQLIQQWAHLPADGQINLSCPGGLYLLQLQNGDQVRTERIVVR
jgi:hypothetical protein